MSVACMFCIMQLGCDRTGRSQTPGNDGCLSIGIRFSAHWLDLPLGKPTEIDYLNGLIVRLGQAHGIAKPVNRALWALVKLLEGRGAGVVAG